MTSILSVQTSQSDVLGEYDVHQPLPYPYHVTSTGEPARADSWHYGLLGFIPGPESEEVLTVEEAIKDPARLRGMYAIGVDDEGPYVDLRPIERAATFNLEGSDL